MKYIDGFDTDNEHETTPEGYRLIACASENMKFTAVTMRVGGGAVCIRTYDEHGGIVDRSIPNECREKENPRWRRTKSAAVSVVAYIFIGLLALFLLPAVPFIACVCAFVRYESWADKKGLW